MATHEGMRRYHALVDGLVQRRAGALATWAREKGWPRLPENAAINALLDQLTADQRQVLARIVEQARDGGMHDTLAFLQEEMDLRGLRLVVDGDELPVSPHDSELHYDFVSRRDGRPWPAR